MRVWSTFLVNLIFVLVSIVGRGGIIIYKYYAKNIVFFRSETDIFKSAICILFKGKNKAVSHVSAMECDHMTGSLK